MANEFKVKKGLVVNGSGSVILDVQGSQGQLFSVTDQLSGSLFSVNDISGIPILAVSSDDSVKLGTFTKEAIKVSGSNAVITGSFTGSLSGSLFGTASWANNASTASFFGGSVISASYASSSTSASFSTQAANATTASYVLTAQTASYVLQAVSASFATSAANATTASYILNAISSSYASSSTSASFATQAANATTASYILNAVSASYASASTSASYASSSTSASFALTASSAGDFLVRGTLTAQTIVAQVITSSTDFVTGSTRFGSLLANTHQFTGSVSMTGSLNVVGTGITGSLFGTASWAQNAVTASYILQAVSASFATTASFALNAGNTKAASGSVASFGGTPRTSSITFASAFSNNLYAVTVTGEDARSFTIQSKTSGSFIINSNSSVALTGPVYWIATAYN